VAAAAPDDDAAI